MNLSKQIILLFLLIITVTFIFFTNYTLNIKYENIITQKSVELQSDLDFLAETIPAHIYFNDSELLEDTLNDVLDSEMFSSIELFSNKNGIIFNKKIDSHKPNFLLSYFIKDNLDSILESSVKYEGKEVATIKAIVNKSFLVFPNIELVLNKILFLYAIFIVISIFCLIKILHPVNTLMLQTRKISKHIYDTEEDEPVSADVHEAIELLNETSSKMKQLFTDSDKFSELIRSNTYKDEITGVANAKYFQVVFDHLLRGTEVGIGGAFIQLSVDYRSKSNEAIKTLTNKLNKLAKINKRIFLVSSFDDENFGLIVKDIPESEINNYTEKLFKAICDYKVNDEIFLQKCFMGVTEYKQGSYVSELLDETEKALMEAKKKKDSSWQKFSKEMQASPYINVNWDNEFNKALDSQDILLHYQPLYYYENDGTILFHNEVLARIISEQKEVIASGIFMPLVSAKQLGSEFDKLVIEKVLDRISESSDGWQRYGINLSNQSLISEEFLNWLEIKIANFGDSVRRVTFEFAEPIVRDNPILVKSFIDIVSKHGVQVGIDHFGVGFSDFSYLEDLNIDFIKIDGSYSRHIQNNNENQAIVRSLVEVAHSLDIKVFATCVELREERDALAKLNIDGNQGYFIGQPT